MVMVYNSQPRKREKPALLNVPIFAEKFRQGMVRSAMVYKIMQSLKLEDDDVRYWAILCIHAVAAEGLGKRWLFIHVKQFFMTF